MKKLAFILAIVFVFLIGQKIAFVHKIWAGEKPPQIVMWVPINENAEFVIDKIKTEGKLINKEDGSKDPPIDARKWKDIHTIKNATVIKFTDDPFCYIFWSEGKWTQRCVEIPK